MDDVCHLHELEVIFKRCVTFSCILMLHAITPIFECIEAFILIFHLKRPVLLVSAMLRALIDRSVICTKEVIFGCSSEASDFVDLMVSVHASQFNPCPLFVSYTHLPA